MRLYVVGARLANPAEPQHVTVMPAGDVADGDERVRRRRHGADAAGATADDEDGEDDEDDEQQANMQSQHVMDQEKTVEEGLVSESPADDDGKESEPPDVPGGAGSSGGDKQLSESQRAIVEMKDCLAVLLAPGDGASSNAMREAMAMLRVLVHRRSDPSRERLSVALTLVYRAMDDHLNDGFVQERACLVLGKLAREGPAVQSAIGTSGGVRAVISTMVMHRQSAVVQERAVLALLSLTGTSNTRTLIMDAKGAEAVVCGMKEFSDLVSVQSNGSTTLCNLAFGSDGNKQRIGKIGGLDAVIQAMSAHAHDQDLQARCCLALRNLSCGVRVNQWIVGRAGGINAIVRAMASYCDDVNVLYQGCVALANLCADEPENRVRSADTGVIEAVLGAMRRHGGHEGLQEHGLALLRNLSIGASRNQLLIGEAGGVQVVVTSLTTHRHNSKILEKGCSALRYLLFSRENRLRMQPAGGLDALIRVLRDYSAGSSAVAESAIYAIGNAVFDLPENKSAVGRSGGIVALVNVMSVHLNDAVVQEHGCRALRNLADADDLNTRLLADSGAIKTAIFAMMSFPGNAHIQEQGCAMLFNMAFSDENIQQMKELDVERVVRSLHETHADSSKVQCQAAALLERLDIPFDQAAYAGSDISNGGGNASNGGSGIFNFGGGSSQTSGGKKKSGQARDNKKSFNGRLGSLLGRKKDHSPKT